MLCHLSLALNLTDPFINSPFLKVSLLSLFENAICFLPGPWSTITFLCLTTHSLSLQTLGILFIFFYTSTCTAPLVSDFWLLALFPSYFWSCSEPFYLKFDFGLPRLKSSLSPKDFLLLLPSVSGQSVLVWKPLNLIFFPNLLDKSLIIPKQGGAYSDLFCVTLLSFFLQLTLQPPPWAISSMNTSEIYVFSPNLSCEHQTHIFNGLFNTAYRCLRGTLS